MSKYTMTLKHVPNRDISGEDTYRGYWEEPVDKEPIQIKRKTLLEMKSEFGSWIYRNGLGGGNVPYVYVTKDNSIIGRFSPNGRFWKDNDNYEEIIIQEEWR